MGVASTDDFGQKVVVLKLRQRRLFVVAAPVRTNHHNISFQHVFSRFGHFFSAPFVSALPLSFMNCNLAAIKLTLRKRSLMRKQLVRAWVTDDWTLFKRCNQFIQPTPHPIFPLQRVRSTRTVTAGNQRRTLFLCLQAVIQQNGRVDVQRAANRS